MLPCRRTSSSIPSSSRRDTRRPRSGPDPTMSRLAPGKRCRIEGIASRAAAAFFSGERRPTVTSRGGPVGSWRGGPSRRARAARVEARGEDPLHRGVSLAWRGPTFAGREHQIGLAHAPQGPIEPPVHEGRAVPPGSTVTHEEALAEEPREDQRGEADVAGYGGVQRRRRRGPGAAAGVRRRAARERNPACAASRGRAARARGGS